MSNIFLSDKHIVTISPKSIIFAVLFVLSLFVMFQIRMIIVLFLVSFILMVALHPMVKFFQRKAHLPKAVSIFISYMIFILIISLIVAVIVPPFVSQTQQLLGTVEFPLIQDQLRSLQFSLRDLSSSLQGLTLQDVSEWREYTSKISESVGVLFNILSVAFSGIFTVLTVFVLSFYLMQERDTLHNKIIWFSKNPDHKENAKRFIDEIEVELGGWVRGQLILMFAIGFITYVGLTILSVPYALPLALLAGLLEIVPNIGPILAAVPAVSIAYLSMGLTMGIIVVLFAIVVQQLENNFFVPKIMSRNANVNPLIALLVILVGFNLDGALGALLSIPIYIILRKVYSLTIRPK